MMECKVNDKLEKKNNMITSCWKKKKKNTENSFNWGVKILKEPSKQLAKKTHKKN